MSRHIPRLYLDMELVTGQQVCVDKQQCHHLLNVLRLTEGDPVTLFNGQGGEFSACISKASKREVALTVQSHMGVNRESKLNILLAQGIARGERMDLVIQKSIELGVQQIQPLHTEKSQRLPADRLQKKLEHWQSVARSAAEQSGRTRMPDIHPPATLPDWLLSKQNRADLKLILDPAAEQPLQGNTRPKSVCILIGPESGLTHSETAQAVKNGYSQVKLGPRVLRTETAGLATISAMQMLWGDFA